MELKKIVEAILFSSSDPLTLSEIVKLTNSSREEVESAIKSLMEEYSKRDSAIEIIQIGSRYLMRVKPEFSDYVEKFVEREFDRGTLRTLAVIAVKQPITLAKLAKIRGNKCYEHVRKLREAGFVKAEKRGRSTILTTTKEFASYFGLKTNDPQEIKKVLKEYYKADDEVYHS